MTLKGAVDRGWLHLAGHVVQAGAAGVMLFVAAEMWATRDAVRELKLLVEQVVIPRLERVETKVEYLEKRAMEAMQ